MLRHRPTPYYGAYLLYRVDDVAAAKAALRHVLPHVTKCCLPGAAPAIYVEHGVYLGGAACVGPSTGGVGQSMEFRVGMAARKEVLGDSGASDPSKWVAAVCVARRISAWCSSSTEDALQVPLEWTATFGASPRSTG